MAVYHTGLHRLYNVQPRENGTQDGIDSGQSPSNVTKRQNSSSWGEFAPWNGTARTCIFPHVFSARTGIGWFSLGKRFHWDQGSTVSSELGLPWSHQTADGLASLQSSSDTVDASCWSSNNYAQCNPMMDTGVSDRYLLAAFKVFWTGTKFLIKRVQSAWWSKNCTTLIKRLVKVPLFTISSCYLTQV